jgi:hypothetical protein
MRAIYRFWVSLMTAAVVVQVGLAGYGAFDVAHRADKHTVNKHFFDHAFTPHGALGELIVLSGLVLLLLSFGARGGRVKLSAIAFVLLVAQLLLGWTGMEAPYILGALHPINAFLILGLLGSITFREWKGKGMGMRDPVASPPA